MNRDENWMFWVVRAKRGESGLAPEREVVKLQFMSVEDAKKFEQIVSGLDKKEE